MRDHATTAGHPAVLIWTRRFTNFHPEDSIMNKTWITSTMSVSGRSLSAALLAGALALGMPSLSAAGGQVETVSVAITYKAKTLQTHEGAAALYARLKSAARRACGSADLRDFKAQRSLSECRSRALDDAVTTIAAPTLLALHRQESGDSRRLASTAQGFNSH
jgi:UrcA family protein